MIKRIYLYCHVIINRISYKFSSIFGILGACTVDKGSRSQHLVQGGVARTAGMVAAESGK